MYNLRRDFKKLQNQAEATKNMAKREKIINEANRTLFTVTSLYRIFNEITDRSGKNDLRNNNQNKRLDIQA